MGFVFSKYCCNEYKNYECIVCLNALLHTRMILLLLSQNATFEVV